MNIKIIIIMICVLATLLNKYNQLEKDKNISIKSEDLPIEFSSNAYNTVVEFIQKTKNLEYECIMYFDYITGQILKFNIGGIDKVKLTFQENEFDGFHVASIHNHPSSVYSPPSEKNFGILMRDFEDYELIVGKSGLWILKAKCINFQLNLDLKYSALMIMKSCQEYAKNRYPPSKANEISDIMYGKVLSNYINDKNINSIQLTKKRYLL